MTTSSTSSSISTPFLPSLPRMSSQKIKPKRVSTLVKCGSRKGAHGRLVDENMIVLRKRIHETKMVERNYEPPSHWMDWEKKCYVGYDEFICDVMAVVQSRLMDTRPSQTLGLALLVALSVPSSATMILFHLVEMSKHVVAGVHVG